MNYGRTMPDWQQYSTLQSGESDRQATNNASLAQQQQQQQQQSQQQQQQAQHQQQQAQSVQPGAGSGGSGGGHLYGLDCLSKPGQNDYYGGGVPQAAAGSPLGQQPPPGMVHHMSSCHVGHGYGAGMPVLEDGRLGLPDDMQPPPPQQQQQQQAQQQHRGSVQMSLSSPNSRLPPVSAGMSLGQIMPGPPPPLPTSASRQTYSAACKAACCQPSVGYRSWDKINPYQQSNPYPSASAYAALDGRSSRYRNDMYRKDGMPTGYALDQQQQQQQQHQQQSQRRYRKESSQVARSYHQPPGPGVLSPGYPNMQSYGYPPAAEYQKYYGGRAMPSQPPHGMIKYPEHGMPVQDKYLAKQPQYQPNGAIMQNGVMVPNSMNPGMPAPYYAPQLGPGDKDPEGRLVGTSPMSLQTKHMYQQKLTMQRLNIENHLREFSRIPGYQNHPKFQEYLAKYRENLRQQESLAYQGMPQQTAMGQPSPSAAPLPPPPTMPPINLQFDQNGVLINSSLMPGYNPNMQPSMPAMPNPLGTDKDAASHYDGKAMQAMEHAIACASQQQSQAQQQQQQQQPTAGAPQISPTSMMQPSPEQLHPHYLPHDEYHHAAVHHPHHPQHHAHPHHHAQMQAPAPPQQQPQPPLEVEAVAVQAQQKPSKDFADKPDIDVRQFLANWDETEEEDGVNGNLQNVILTDSTPIAVVLELENVNLAADNLTTQAICVSGEKEAPTVALALPTQKPVGKDQIAGANGETAVATTAESAISTVNIIRCITSGDEVPTIHIVDTLENEAVVKKIEGAFHSLNSADIKSIEELVNKSTVAAGGGGNKEERIALSFLNTAAILQTKEAEEKSADKPSNDESATSKPSSEQPNPTENKTEAAEKSNTDAPANLNLGTGSFVNEDTRNHDDLSLPELPTTVCTPISTTLNTPTHSDNEESSERVRVLSISTNSMEIMPSSPIISFAHSPIKFQKATTSDELQFDFQNSNEASNASVSKDAGAAASSVAKDGTNSNSKDSQDAKPPAEAEKNNTVPSIPSVSQEQPCSSVMDTTVFGFTEFSNSSSLQLGEEPKMPAPPMEGNCLTKIIKDTPPITDIRVLDSDDDLVDKVDDIWMNMNLEGSLVNSANKLVASEVKHVQTDKLRKTSLRHFRRNKNIVAPYTENSSVAEKVAERTPEKAKEVSEVIIIDEPPKETNKAPVITKHLEKERKTRKSLDSSTKSHTTERPRKRAKSVELDSNSTQDQDELLKEFKSLKRKRSIGQMQDDIKMLKSSLDELRNSKNNINTSVITDNASTANNTVNKTIQDNSVSKNASLPMLPDTKETSSTRRRFSSIFDDPADSCLEKVSEDNHPTQCVDSDINIQLSNVNLQIKDKKETTVGSGCNGSGQKEGIKIEINVSRVESQRLQDNEIVSKSNQQLNISLPSIDPMSRKVDCKTSISMNEEVKEPVKTLESCVLPEKETMEEKTLVEKIKDNSEKIKESKLFTEETKEEAIIAFENKNAKLVDSKCLILENSVASGPEKETILDDIPLKKLNKKEADIENALKKLEECRRDSLHEVDEESEKPIAKEKEIDCLQNKNFVETPAPGCSKDLDFDNFDVEPYDDKSDDYLKDLLISTNSSDHHRHHSNSEGNSKTVGFFNPLFHLDELENLNTVPVYTTKDGKITYSPNPNYTYRALIIEARQREGHALFRDFYDNKLGNDKKRSRYSSSKSQDEWYGKRYKPSKHKYKYDDKRDKYNNLLSFENCLANQSVDKTEIDNDETRSTSARDEWKKKETLISDPEKDKSNFESDIIPLNTDKSEENIRMEEETTSSDVKRLSPVPHSPPSQLLKSDRNMPILDENFEDSQRCPSPKKDSDVKNINRCNFDLQNLKDDVLKKLNDQELEYKARLKELDDKNLNVNTVMDRKESRQEGEEKTKSKVDETIREKIMKEDFNFSEVHKVESEKVGKQIEKETEFLVIPNTSVAKFELKDNENKSVKNLQKEITSEVAKSGNIEVKEDEPKKECNVNTVRKSDDKAQENEFVAEPVKIKEVKIKEVEMKDVVIKEVEIKDAVIKEIEIKEVDIKVAEIKEVEINEVEIKEIDVEETEIKEVEIKEVKDNESGLDLDIVQNETIDSLESEISVCIAKPEVSASPTQNSISENMEKIVNKNDTVLDEAEKLESAPNKLKNSAEDNIYSQEIKSDVSNANKSEQKEKVGPLKSSIEKKPIPETVDKKEESVHLQTLESTPLEPIKVNNSDYASPKDSPKNKIIESKEVQKNATTPKIIENSKEEVQKGASSPKTMYNEKVASPESQLKLTCSIDKSNFSSELCNRFDQQKLLSAQSDISRIVPKLVIRKSDSNPKCFSKSKSIEHNLIDDAKKETADHTTKNTVHPKIPKMIIRNAKSRPSTPSIEEISESSYSSTPDNDTKSLKVKIKLDEKGEALSQKPSNSSELSEAKVPKMKIKLEEKLPRVVIENIDLSSIEDQKIVPKMKITNVKGSMPKIKDKRSAAEDKSDVHSLTDTEERRTREKSRLRAKKDSPGYHSCSEMSQKRNATSASSQSKRAKRSPKEEVHLDPTMEDTQFLLENEYKQKNNSNSCSSVSTKIPKVIIKRTSPSAEFKCELSKEAIFNAQPQVVLRRSSFLDCMAKDLRHMKVMVKVTSTKEEAKQESKLESNELEWQRFISGLKKRREQLSRSNSASELNRPLPSKVKRRRTSDYTVGNYDTSDSDSGTRFAFTRKKVEEAQLMNSSSKEIEFSEAKSYWRTLDENMNSKSKPDMESDDSRGKLEPINEASESREDTTSKEQEVLRVMDDELLDKDVDVHEEEVDGTLDEFETNDNSIIKVESSDESETTIEILPASPDLSHELDAEMPKEMAEEEEQQIYSEDAVPLHYEYELEVGDSAVDPLEVPIPTSETETDKTSSSIENKQIPGILIHEQLAIEDNISGNTSLNEAEPCQLTDSKNSSSNSVEVVETETPETALLRLVDDGSSTSASLQGGVVAAESATSSSNSQGMLTSSTTADDEEEGSRPASGCSYSDLLVREVLAAKETLKKYLGNLNGEAPTPPPPPPMTEAPAKVKTERSQSTSFDPKFGKNLSSTATTYRHRDKRRRLIRGKSRCSEGRASSSSRRESEHRPSESHRSHRDKSATRLKSHRAPRHGDPLSHVVEENLRQLRQREMAEEKAEPAPSVEPLPPVDDLEKRLENVISRSDETNAKMKAIKLNPEMTISSIVRDLVFHDKATIRHRRYCMLCERWFPSTLRHRRHLAGYQHRHTELTQRRAIHMLFLIFTGEFCPKLLPPDVVRTDCAPGEPTPLQIAVQDFAMVFDRLQQITGKQSNETKE